MNGSSIPCFDTEQARATLLQHLGGRVWDLRVERRDGRIVLSGCAQSYYAKQLAQHMVMRSVGASAIANEIEVVPPRKAEDQGPKD
jgi:hypothetical protein